MNSYHQPHPGQYSQPQTIQSTQFPHANGQATAYDNHQLHGPQASEATRSSTATTTQPYTVPAAPQYLQQPFQYLSPGGPVTMGAGYQQTPTTGANHIVQPQHTQNQQPMISQVSQQPPVLQPQLQPPVIPQESLQPLPQHYSMASGMQFSDQSQQITQQQQQQQMFQQPTIPQQPRQLPAVDFTQLLISSPAPQQVPGNDFSQLMQAAPPVNTSSSMVTTITTRTEIYKGANAGGEARKQAEAKGDQETQRFEEKVQKLIRRICPCPRGVRWYNSPEGYMCAEGIHFLYHKNIDTAFERPGWIPRVTWVNTTNNPEAQACGQVFLFHPPQAAFDQPMHRVHASFARLMKQEGAVFRGENRDGRKRQGCTDECLDGLGSMEEGDAVRFLRRSGFDPNATRHALFR